MKVVVEDRSSIILYNVLKELQFKVDKLKFFIPSNVCPIVPATFLRAGVKYQFVDIDNETLNIDLKKIQEETENVTENYGLLFVRYLGNMTDVDSDFEKLKTKNVFIIDDRCPCRPTFNRNELSAHSDITLFSTGYAKYVELGYGGYAYVDTDKINYVRNKFKYSEQTHNEITKVFNECIKKKRKFVFDKNDWLGNTEKLYDFENYKRIILENLFKVDEHKRKLNDFYRTNLPDEIQYKTDYQNWRFNILVNNKNKLLKEIFKNGLFASSHYASISNVFSNMKSPKAEKLHDRTINLFNDHRFDIEKAGLLCEIIRKLN